MISRRKFIVSLSSGALAVPLASFAQEPKKIPRIGILSATSASTVTARIEAFRQGLRELGYVEGKNIVLDFRYAEGNLDRLGELAAELVRDNVDVIFSAGPAATRPAREKAPTTPIVMGFDYDPVGNGFAASLARPGGNITGLSTLAPEITAKQLELLKEILPRLVRVAVLWSSAEPGGALIQKETERAARALKVQVQYLDVRSPREIEAAFGEARKGRADAVLALTTPALSIHRALLADLALKNRLPTVYGEPEYVDAGGFLTYGVNLAELFRRAATYVDKILKGARPGDLPVEQPTAFDLVINMKTARALGIKVPRSILFRADRVIE